MRRALDPRPSTRNDSISATLPAPTGGWNTRDGLANMPVEDAISMDNMFPEATDVRPRPGSDTYASGLGTATQAETLISYDNGTLLKFFVVAGNVIQNISTVGVSGTVSSGTVGAGTAAFQNSRFNSRQFGTPGGHFTVMVNGADQRQIYDGTVWYQGSTYCASTIAAFSNLEVFNARLFYLEEGTLRVLYHTNTNAIGGTVGIAMDLGSEFSMGGSGLCIGTWTRDGGSGMDDFLVVASDKGQVAVYQGIDPSSASTWAKVGVYTIPPPLSERCMEKMGGELLIATKAGVVAMSGVLSGLVQQTPITDKIRTSINEAVATYGSHWGWELRYVPYKNWLMLNVPVATGSYQQQFVMNTQTAAWCRFKNWSANTFVVHNGQLYYGGAASVVSAGTSSNSDDGADISVDVRQSANVFGAPARQKHFKLFRLLLNADGQVSLAADINVDFADTIPTNIPAVTPISVAEWDVATWDDYYWADDAVPANFWQSTGNLGTYGSIRLKGSINGVASRWYGTDVVYEVGGML